MGFIGSLTGSDGAKSAARATRFQQKSINQAMDTTRGAYDDAGAYFDPFQGMIQQAGQGSDIIADPQAQYDFLQNNPLFQLAMDNANRQTMQGAAAGGRINAGDTLTDLTNNTMLQAMPFLDRQRQDIQMGMGLASNMGNLALGEGQDIAGYQTDIGNVRAAGQIAKSNARAAGAQGLLSAGTALAGGMMGMPVPPPPQDYGGGGGNEWNLPF